MDALAAAIWYAVTVAVILAFWIAVRRAFPADGAVQCTMHTVVCVWATIAVVSALLGTIGVLNATGLALGVLLAAFGACFWSLRLASAPVPPPDPSPIRIGGEF